MTDAPDPEAVVEDLQHPVILYDGVCNLCNGFVRLAVRFDTAGVFRFAPLQSPVGRVLLDRQGMPTDDFESFVLIEDDERYTKSTAALRVARRLDRPLPVLYPLVYLPRRLRDAVYDLVAKYRYRVFGRTDECQVPDPELRRRFLERSLE